MNGPSLLGIFAAQAYAGGRLDYVGPNVHVNWRRTQTALYIDAVETRKWEHRKPYKVERMTRAESLMGIQRAINRAATEIELKIRDSRALDHAREAVYIRLGNNFINAEKADEMGIGDIFWVPIKELNLEQCGRALVALEKLNHGQIQV